MWGRETMERECWLRWRETGEEKSWPAAQGVKKKSNGGWLCMRGFRLGFFVFFRCCQNYPPLECVEETSIYRQNVAVFFNLVPQLLSFFVNFDFSYFFVFF